MTDTTQLDPPVELTEYDYDPVIDELRALASTGISQYEVFTDFVNVGAFEVRFQNVVLGNGPGFVPYAACCPARHVP